MIDNRLILVAVFSVYIFSAIGESVIPDNSVCWAANAYQIFFTEQTDEWTSGALREPLIKPLRFNGAGYIVGMAYDYDAGHLITSDVTKKMLILTDLSLSQASPLHIGTSKDIGQVAIDWKSRNVYWADGGYGWIAMKAIPNHIGNVNSFDPHFKLLVDKYLDKPTGIAVHPQKHYLFWADAGINPKIERSNLMGEERRVVTWYGLIRPTTLYIDSDKIYWTDLARGTIEYSDFDGGHRRVFVSNPGYDFYGLAIFQDNVIFTAPSSNITGSISLRETQYGNIENPLQIDIPFYHVIVYKSQPRQSTEDCDTFGCSDICVQLEDNVSCFCQDGYSLDTDSKNCIQTNTVLERHLLFTRNSTICAIAINFINSVDQAPSFPRDCDVVQHDDVITKFAIDAAREVVFYTDGRKIYKQKMHLIGEVENEELYLTSNDILDLDYDWKSQELFWSERGGGVLYYLSVGETIGEVNNKDLSETDIRNIAVDPHNRCVYWISKPDINSDATIYIWDRRTDNSRPINTVIMRTPTDLEYDRLNDRLVWNDGNGFIGAINTDGTKEIKIHTYADTKDDKLALTVFKKFIIATTADNKQFDVIYERDDSLTSVDIAADSLSVLDMHVFDTTLQPSDLEPCAIDNGECDHICLPDDGRQTCACHLGYSLHTDGKTCSTSFASDDFYLVLDSLHKNIYQAVNGTDKINILDTGDSNTPSSFAFDPTRNELIWVDRRSKLVKRKQHGKESISALGTTVDEDSSIALDVTGGNIYVTSGAKIILIGPNENVKTINNDNEGQLGPMAVNAQYGVMVWFRESSGGDMTLVMANMDGSNVKQVTTDIGKPEDVIFDLEDGNDLYWCDSDKDKIEKVNKDSLESEVIYSGSELKPVALDIVGKFVFFIARNQRKIFRINKVDGTGLEVVLESPLLGTLIGLYVFKPSPKVHEVCDNCNGRCSTICVPKGLLKTCACADGTELLADGTTCQHIQRCPDIGTAEGFIKLPSSCCPGMPNAVCSPVCKMGFIAKQSQVQCSNGLWSHGAEELCSKDIVGKGEDEASKGPPVAAIAGGVIGGLLVIIVGVIIIVVARRRRDRYKDTQRRPSSLPSRLQVNRGFVNSTDDQKGQQNNTKTTRSSKDEDEEVYDTINDKLVVKDKKDSKNTFRDGHKHGDDPRGSQKSERYTGFPVEIENNGYLTASGADRRSAFPTVVDQYYIDFNKRNTVEMNDWDKAPDGYLESRSISGGSRRSAGLDDMEGALGNQDYIYTGGSVISYGGSSRNNDNDGYSSNRGNVDSSNRGNVERQQDIDIPRRNTEKVPNPQRYDVKRAGSTTSSQLKFDSSYGKVSYRQ